MRIIFKAKIHCDYSNLKRYLPAQYISLIPKCYYGEVVNLVIFPVDKFAINSREVIKAHQKIVDTEIKTFYFAQCFTTEAIKFITENNGAAFELDDFVWSDEDCNRIRNNIYSIL